MLVHGYGMVRVWWGSRRGVGRCMLGAWCAFVSSLHAPPPNRRLSSVATSCKLQHPLCPRQPLRPVVAKDLHTQKSRKWRFGTHATPWHLGFGCPLWVGEATNAPQFQGHPPLGAKKPPGGHASCPKAAKNHQNASGDRKQPTPRPKWQRSVGISNQLQKLARNTCGHALARFWPLGPMQQA